MEAPTLDLKKTVHLPRTDFPMKANLPTTEPRILERWEREDLYGKIRQSRAGRKRWVLHDGPPYANGNIHLGTAFNKIVKDFVVKSKTMEGFDSPYVPGWDCHGLPIENKVDQELGGKKAHMSPGELRAACRKYAEKYVGIHRREFKRLGVLGQWDRPYLTMSAEYQATIAQAFVDFLDRGYVYRGLKPVNWCLFHRTALAEAEVEYEDHKSPSIWVRFRLASDPAKIDPALAGKPVYGLIWTTTPWTMPANMAISYHPRFVYVAAETADGVYLVAKDLLGATAQAADWNEPRVLAEFPGDRLDGAVFRHPFLERDSLGILGEHVTLEAGTGAVHTAPGHGAEDYVVAQQYRIPTYCPVDASGRFYHAEGAAGRLPEELIGKTVWEANPVVIEILKAGGALVAEQKVDHSYPHCWRCHKPTIFRATDQWFINMEHEGLRERSLAAIRKVRWHPAWGEERISNMIASRPDWCISRQRVWGVPIIAFHCEDCQGLVADRKILENVVAEFRRHTADVWYERSAAELSGGAACPKCGSQNLRKEMDILDVWFDSGSSHLAVLTPENGLEWPSDMYLEGGDQYRGWFHSSLLIGVGLKGDAPYRESATHGWALDGEGKAMSKSLGNIIEPQEIVSKHGADVLRLWAASVDFMEDVRMSPVILERLTEAYRKLRNTLRYALGNLAGFDPGRDAVSAAEMHEIDRWILGRTGELVRKCREAYASYEFHKVYRAIYDFATTDLSAVYFDILKDRLYTAATRSRARRSGQTALFRIHYALLRLLAPILSYTAEEAWGYTPLPAGAPESVHLAEFPAPGEVTEGITEAQRAAFAKWDRLMEVREAVLKALEEARQAKVIGAPLEAKVTLAGADAVTREYAAELPAVFIVSEVELRGSAEFRVEVTRASGVKCERCWKYTHDVGADAGLPTVCAACAGAVREMAEAR
jgi:isoleucyl-tRNA synthetase